MLYATCQRLNDGSQSTPAQLSRHGVKVHGLMCTSAHVCVSGRGGRGGVIKHLNVPLCVFLRSRVNYTGHDVKGRSLVVKTLPAPLSCYHGDRAANFSKFLNSSATVINVIYMDLVPFAN